MNQTGPARFVEHVDFSDIEPVSKTIWPGIRYDYVSPGLTRPDFTAAFPDLVARDPAPLQWPYLRKDAPHIWRSRFAQLAKSRHRRALGRRGRRPLQQRSSDAGRARPRDRLPLRLVDRPSPRRGIGSATSSIPGWAIPIRRATSPTVSRASAGRAGRGSGRASRPRSFPPCGRRRRRPGLSRSSMAITRAERRWTTRRR